MILDNIEVDGERFEVDFYLGADWKVSPNCTHACIWCTCLKNQRHNGEKEWSITLRELIQLS